MWCAGCEDNSAHSKGLESADPFAALDQISVDAVTSGPLVELQKRSFVKMFQSLPPSMIPIPNYLTTFSKFYHATGTDHDYHGRNHRSRGFLPFHRPNFYDFGIEIVSPGPSTKHGSIREVRLISIFFFKKKGTLQTLKNLRIDGALGSVAAGTRAASLRNSIIAFMRTLFSSLGRLPSRYLRSSAEWLEDRVAVDCAGELATAIISYSLIGENGGACECVIQLAVSKANSWLWTFLS